MNLLNRMDVQSDDLPTCKVNGARSVRARGSSGSMRLFCAGEFGRAISASFATRAPLLSPPRFFNQSHIKL
jgi:hypothetical protein